MTAFESGWQRKCAYCGAPAGGTSPCCPECHRDMHAHCPSWPSCAREGYDRPCDATPQTPASSPLGGAGQDDGRVLTEGESGGTPPSFWKRGDVVLDDSGNMFAFHPTHGWCGLGSNQASARGWYAADGTDGHPYEPVTLLIRDHRPTGAAS